MSTTNDALRGFMQRIKADVEPTPEPPGSNAGSVQDETLEFSDLKLKNLPYNTSGEVIGPGSIDPRDLEKLLDQRAPIAAVNYGQLLDSEFDEHLRGKDGYLIYRQMMADGTIKNALSYLSAQMRTVKWKIQPASMSEEDIEVAAFVADQLGLDDTGVGKSSFGKLLDVYLNALIYGRASAELVMAPGADSKIILDRIVSIHPFTISEIEYDVNGNPKTYVLSGEVKGTGKIIHNKRIPIWKTVTFLHDDDGSGEGTSILRAAVGHWRIKRSLIVALNQGMDRHLIGVPIIHLPNSVRKGTQQWEEAMAILRNYVVRPRTGVLLRPDWEFETIKLGSISPVDALPYLEYHDAAIARSLGIDWNTIKTESHSVQYNVGALEQMTLSTVKQLLMEFTSAVNLHLIPKLLLLNWPNLRMFPKLQFDIDRQEDFSAVANLMGMLINAANRNLGDRAKLEIERQALTEQSTNTAESGQQYAEPDSTDGEYETTGDLVTELLRLMDAMPPRFKKALGYDEMQINDRMNVYRANQYTIYPADGRRNPSSTRSSSESRQSNEPHYGPNVGIRRPARFERNY